MSLLLLAVQLSFCPEVVFHSMPKKIPLPRGSASKGVSQLPAPREPTSRSTPMNADPKQLRRIVQEEMALIRGDLESAELVQWVRTEVDRYLAALQRSK